MNVIVKRRQLILATLVVALGAAVFVNWYYTGNNNISEQNASENSEYVQNLGEAKYVNATQTQTKSFEEMKFDRQKEQDETLDKLNESLKNATPGTEEAKTITASINAITKKNESQTSLENLIKTKINAECIVTLTENNAQVVVGKGVLNETTSLQILEIVTSNTDVDSANVIMSEQK